MSGITLIALIITIIVLLILAGVTINVVVGDNGVLTQAQKAKVETDFTKEKEAIEMAIVSSYTEASNYTKIGSAQLQNELGKNFDDYIFNENADGTFTIKLENREYQVSETGTLIYIEHIIDTTPGVLAGNGTESSPYLIESGEDLVVFSYNVRNGNSYEGKYVELKNNINLASLNSFVDGERTDYAEYGYDGKLKDKIQEIGFISIGQTEFTPDEMTNITTNNNIFKGTFNGNNYTISNYNINVNLNVEEVSIRFGLFSINLGIIKNLNLIANAECNFTSRKFCCVGILCGESRGQILNCSTAGKIIGISNYMSFNFGGVAGSNASGGSIIACYNGAIIVGALVSSEVQGVELRLGGIVGANEVGSNIENCYNFGDIILGNNLENDSTVSSFSAGGIAGLASGTYCNVYNTGNILNHLTQYLLLRAGLCSGRATKENLSKYYSLDRCFIENSSWNYDVVIMTEAEMKSDDFVNTLNEGLETPVWKKDNGINNGYPILSWQ